MPQPQRSGTPTLAPSEVTAVLPAFGLGKIRSVRAFTRGNPFSPKAVIGSAAGMFILKRRAESSGDLDRIEREHAVQAALRARGVPVALPDHGGPTAVEASGRVYELMRFVEGEPARAGLGAARTAGGVLARIHAVPVETLRLDESWSPVSGLVDRAIARLSADTPALRVPLESMHHDWHVALDRLSPRHRIETGSVRPVLQHGDFHPANLIWNGAALAAVVDFEATGLGLRAAELASAALLFSLETTGHSPAGWPESPDITRLTAFAAGYTEADGDAEDAIDPADQPWWMIHGLIAQAMHRAVRSHGFGQHDAAGVIPFVARTSAWIRDHADGLGVVIADELVSSHDPR